MTTRSLPSGGQVTLTELPDPPKSPYAMQQRPHIARADQTLRGHYRQRGDVLVSGGGYLCYDASDLRRAPHPDCLVAFGLTVPPQLIEDIANGYVISELGKPPDFVLEVASPTTGRRDYTVKREIYAAYRVGEFWRFDRTGGRYHDTGLAGDLLFGNAYRRAEVVTGPDGVMRGYSPALGLELHWREGRLRFWDPETRAYLLDPVEAVAELAAARMAREVAEGQSILERAARQDAEARAAAEIVARQDAEGRAAAEIIARQGAEGRAAAEIIARQDAEMRAAQAEERIRRLRAKLRGESPADPGAGAG